MNNNYNLECDHWSNGLAVNQTHVHIPQSKNSLNNTCPLLTI